MLDIGCGKAWLLLRIASRFAIGGGVGVELRESGGLIEIGDILGDVRESRERELRR